MERVFINPPESGPVCDFCSAEEVWGAYSCREFIAMRVGGFDLGSDEGWTACRVCSGLIDKGDWKGLEDRAVYQFTHMHAITDMLAVLHIRLEVRGIHQKFKEFRRQAV